MRKRTTLELEEGLLDRAQRALGAPTARATVEAALRLAAQAAEGAQAERAAGQRRYLRALSSRVDLRVLSSEEMWR